MKKTSTRTSQRYGPNGICMRRGAQYKVLSTIYNILGQNSKVSLIRCACVQVTVSTEHFTHERRLRPRDRPRSSQRPRHYRCRTCACAPDRVRKDTAAKRPKRFRQSRARAAARHNRAWPAAAAQVAKSQLRLVDDHPASDRDHGSDHSDHCQRAEELSTPLTAANLLHHHLQPKQPNPAAEHG